MTSIWENTTFGIPYQMVDLMEQYLAQKCVRFERAIGEITPHHQGYSLWTPVVTTLYIFTV